MPNLDNLKPFNTMPVEKQREIAKQGGIASGKSRLRKKLLRVKLHLDFEKAVEENEQEKVTMRKAFRKNDLLLFRHKAVEYLKMDHDRKTVNGLCEHLGITRYTLSKYRNRGLEWQQTIDEIKKTINAYNCDKKVCKEYEKLIEYAEKFNKQGLSFYP